MYKKKEWEKLWADMILKKRRHIGKIRKEKGDKTDLLNYKIILCTLLFQ